jgi:hypothetical protein
MDPAGRPAARIERAEIFFHQDGKDNVVPNKGRIKARP